MAITGHLAEFSLAEIFQFLEQGHKTGLLTITPLPEPKEPGKPRSHYVWFQQGRVVAAASRSDQRGLIGLISQRGFLGDRAAQRLAQTCDPTQALGLCLKSQNILQAEQLKLLFYVQVMRQVCTLFTLIDGWFHFDSNRLAPPLELTGLSAPANEVTLAGLRALRDWSNLEEKLPSAASALIAVVDGKPSMKLNQVEWQLWEFTNGNVSLNELAQHINQPVEKVRQIAFRLIVVGLVEEIPIVTNSEPNFAPEIDFTNEAATANSQVSQSFLQGLMGFLKGHAGGS